MVLLFNFYMFLFAKTDCQWNKVIEVVSIEHLNVTSGSSYTDIDWHEIISIRKSIRENFSFILHIAVRVFTFCQKRSSPILQFLIKSTCIDLNTNVC